MILINVIVYFRKQQNSICAFFDKCQLMPINWSMWHRGMCQAIMTLNQLLFVVVFIYLHSVVCCSETVHAQYHKMLYHSLHNGIARTDADGSIDTNTRLVFHQIREGRDDESIIDCNCTLDHRQSCLPYQICITVDYAPYGFALKRGKRSITVSLRRCKFDLSVEEM